MRAIAADLSSSGPSEIFVRHLARPQLSASTNLLVMYHSPWSPAGHTTLISPAVTKAIRTAPPTLRIDIHIHVTRHSSNSTPNPVSESTRSSEECMNSSSSQAHDPGKMFVAGSPEKQTSDVKSMLDMSVVKLHSGRPNISSILEEESGVARGERMGVSGRFFCILKY